MTKEALVCYHQLNIELEHLDSLISELRADITSPRISRLSGMPKAPSGRDLMAERMNKLLELEAVYNDKWDSLIDLRKEIEDCLDFLSPTERTIIRYKYFDALPWDYVASKMGYDRSHVFRIHKKALDKLKNIAEKGA